MSAFVTQPAPPLPLGQTVTIRLSDPRPLRRVRWEAERARTVVGEGAEVQVTWWLEDLLGVDPQAASREARGLLAELRGLVARFHAEYETARGKRGDIARGLHLRDVVAPLGHEIGKVTDRFAAFAGRMGLQDEERPVRVACEVVREDGRTERLEESLSLALLGPEERRLAGELRRAREAIARGRAEAARIQEETTGALDRVPDIDRMLPHLDAVDAGVVAVADHGQAFADAILARLAPRPRARGVASDADEREAERHEGRLQGTRKGALAALGRALDQARGFVREIPGRVAREARWNLAPAALFEDAIRYWRQRSHIRRLEEVLTQELTPRERRGVEWELAVDESILEELRRDALWVHAPRAVLFVLGRLFPSVGQVLQVHGIHGGDAAWKDLERTIHETLDALRAGHGRELEPREGDLALRLARHARFKRPGEPGHTGQEAEALAAERGAARSSWWRRSFVMLSAAFTLGTSDPALAGPYGLASGGALPPGGGGATYEQVVQDREVVEAAAIQGFYERLVETHVRSRLPGDVAVVRFMGQLHVSVRSEMPGRTVRLERVITPDGVRLRHAWLEGVSEDLLVEERSFLERRLPGARIVDDGQEAALAYNRFVTVVRSGIQKRQADILKVVSARVPTYGEGPITAEVWERLTEDDRRAIAGHILEGIKEGATTGARDVRLGHLREDLGRLPAYQALLALLGSLGQDPSTAEVELALAAVAVGGYYVNAKYVEPLSRGEFVDLPRVPIPIEVGGGTLRIEVGGRTNLKSVDWRADLAFDREDRASGERLHARIGFDGTAPDGKPVLRVETLLKRPMGGGSATLTGDADYDPRSGHHATHEGLAWSARGYTLSLDHGYASREARHRLGLGAGREVEVKRGRLSLGTGLGLTEGRGPAWTPYLKYSRDRWSVGAEGRLDDEGKAIMLRFGLRFRQGGGIGSTALEAEALDHEKRVRRLAWWRNLAAAGAVLWVLDPTATPPGAGLPLEGPRAALVETVGARALAADPATLLGPEARGFFEDVDRGVAGLSGALHADLDAVKDLPLGGGYRLDVPQGTAAQLWFDLEDRRSPSLRLNLHPRVRLVKDRAPDIEISTIELGSGGRVRTNARFASWALAHAPFLKDRPERACSAAVERLIASSPAFLAALSPAPGLVDLDAMARLLSGEPRGSAPAGATRVWDRLVGGGKPRPVYVALHARTAEPWKKSFEGVDLSLAEDATVSVHADLRHEGGRWSLRRDRPLRLAFGGPGGGLRVGSAGHPLASALVGLGVEEATLHPSGEVKTRWASGPLNLLVPDTELKSRMEAGEKRAAEALRRFIADTDPASPLAPFRDYLDLPRRKGARRPSAATGPGRALGALRGAGADPGRPLAGRPRRLLEGYFGADLAPVRVHTGARSGQAAAALGAEAFTLGRDVYFGEGRYEPSSGRGLGLIAHEVTHVLQSGAGTQAKALGAGRGVSALEAAARRVEVGVLAGDAETRRAVRFEAVDVGIAWRAREGAPGDAVRVRGLAGLAVEEAARRLEADPDLPGAGRVDEVELSLDVDLDREDDEGVVDRWARSVAVAVRAAARPTDRPRRRAADVRRPLAKHLAFGDPKNVMGFSWELEGGDLRVFDYYRPQDIPEPEWKGLDRAEQVFRMARGVDRERWAGMSWEDRYRHLGGGSSKLSYEGWPLMDATEGGRFLRADLMQEVSPLCWETTYAGTDRKGYTEEPGELVSAAVWAKRRLDQRGGFHWHLSFQYSPEDADAIADYLLYASDYLSLKLFMNARSVHHCFLGPYDAHQVAQMRQALRDRSLHVKAVSTEKFTSFALRTHNKEGKRLYGEADRIGYEIRGIPVSAGGTRENPDLSDIETARHMVRTTAGFLEDPAHAPVRLEVHNQGAERTLAEAIRCRQSRGDTTTPVLRALGRLKEKSGETLEFMLSLAQAVPVTYTPPGASRPETRVPWYDQRELPTTPRYDRRDWRLLSRWAYPLVEWEDRMFIPEGAAEEIRSGREEYERALYATAVKYGFKVPEGDKKRVEAQDHIERAVARWGNGLQLWQYM